MILFTDTETGGLEHGQDALLQLAAVLTDDDLNVVSTFESYVYPPPGLNISDGALEATGLDLEQCLNAPTEEIVLGMFDEWALFHLDDWKELPLFAGYNCGFDLQVLEAAFVRHGYECRPYRVDPKRGGFDVLALARKKWKKKDLPQVLNEKTGKTHTHILFDICVYLGIPLLNAHNAVADVLATIEVAKHVRHLWT